MSLNGRGPHQVVKVKPARESERVNGSARPLMCFIIGHTDPDQPKPITLASVPVTFTDMGHPSDVVARFAEGVVVTQLDFVWRDRVFQHVVHPTWVPQGETLHLALAHLKLLDRFGIDVIDSGR